MIRSKHTLHFTYYIPSFFLLAFMFISCGKSLPTLDGVDLPSWKADKYGCLGKRLAMQASIDSQYEKLLALKEMQIVEVLGKPDLNELTKRNQKIYYYYYQSATECNPADSTITSKRLAIRFNAMGLAKEIAVE